jgi:hypothetical protein
LPAITTAATTAGAIFGTIGSKAFVSIHYQRFQHLFASKNRKIPKPVKGLCGIYSLKRLSEIL